MGQAVRQRLPSGQRRGVTLLELIVVMALLGLIVALAAPAIVPSAERPKPELNVILDRARRAALLRGEPVTVTIDEQRWFIEGDASPASSPIASGTLVAPVPRLRVHISPIGTCILDAGPRATPTGWNALDCRITTEGRVP